MRAGRVRPGTVRKPAEREPAEKSRMIFIIAASSGAASSAFRKASLRSTLAMPAHVWRCFWNWPAGTR